jgi:hypothetical protein
MKPLSLDSHKYIGEWVKSGGILVYCGRDNDPFQSVQEWWNSGENDYMRPSDHLFELMGLNEFPSEGEYKYGKGTVYIIRKDPKEFVLDEGKDLELINIVKKLYEDKGDTLNFKNNFSLIRGPYEIISVLEESVSPDAYTINGKLIDLFDPQLPVLDKKVVKIGEQAYLFNIGKVKDPMKPQVLAAASRVYEEKITKTNYSFVTKGSLNTTNVMRILLPSKPLKCEIKDYLGNKLEKATCEWDENSKTCRLNFENDPDGVHVSISFH